MSPESPSANVLKLVCYTETIFTTELMARWLTLIGVLLSLAGGEGREGGHDLSGYGSLQGHAAAAAWTGVAELHASYCQF
jgi:hypothetical protein